MKVRLVRDPAAFLAAAGPLLVAEEPRHNLILGIAGTLRDDPGVYPDHRLWLVEARNKVVGAALRTPPNKLVLGRLSAGGAAEALAAAIGESLPGVVGAYPEVAAFATAWSAATGLEARPLVSQGIYSLSAVNRPAGVPGTPRAAGTADRALLVDWWKAFAVEALRESDPDVGSITDAVEHRLDTTGWGLVVWEDGGEPVSFAGYGGATPNGVRIGPVYTPPERRGHGYASALVASVSADRLAEGKRSCFLYTDLANATSNRIYAQIGYKWVCESAEIEFVRPA